MTRLLAALCTLTALAGCATGGGYVGVEGGPTTVTHLHSR